MSILRSRQAPLVAGILLLTLANTAFFYTKGRVNPKNLETVEPGILYRSATLTPEQLAAVVDEFGIRTVVNLRSLEENAAGTWHEKQGSTLAAREVELLDLPMYSGWPPEQDILARWQSLLEEPGKRPMLVHCEHGVIRTGMMVAIYRLENGVPLERVLRFTDEMDDPIRQRVREFLTGYSAALSPGAGTSPST